MGQMQGFENIGDEWDWVLPSFPKICLRVFHSKKKLAKFFRKHQGYCTDIPDEPACTFIPSPSLGPKYIIFINPYVGYNDFCEQIGIVTHECYHVAEHYCKEVLECRNVGDEMEAYVIQAVSFYVTVCHMKWLKRKKLLRKALEKGVARHG